MIAILGNQDGFGVKLSRLPDFKYESIPAKEFIDELKSNGLTSSKITSINANLEGKGYSLVKYSITSGKTGRGFLFDFRDVKFSGFFFNEREKKSIDESTIDYEDLDEITIDSMLKQARKLYPNNSDGGKTSPIVGIVDGHLADFTAFTFAKHEGHPDPGTFFLHDGTPNSLAVLEEQLVALYYHEAGSISENEDNPDDAKADDLFIKGDEYEKELKAKAKLAKEKKNEK